ncbi:MAG: polyamine aminopropyltransferase [Spirochaetota bacterium]
MTDGKDRRRLLLLLTVLIISTSGLAYELIAGTMATYLLGQSVTQFSFAMGWFMAAMGVGSYLTRFTKENLVPTLLKVQIILSLTGGFSAFLLFLAFAHTDNLYPFFFLLSLITGAAVGFEIPLILRIIGKYRVLSLAVSEVFTFDYIGALFASILFPLLILPYMGLIRASMFFGLFNSTAGLLIHFIDPSKAKNHLLKYSLFLTIVILLAGFSLSSYLTKWIEGVLYQDPIVLAKETKYQRIIITKWKDDVRLFLNGNLQFSSRDEARYHESIVHVPIAKMNTPPKTVLILGGGDGMVIREVLKYQEISSIDLVDLDKEMVTLFQKHPYLRTLNDGALSSKKLQIYNQDAFRWLKNLDRKQKYDLIIADLPDPNSYSLGKLYTVSFYLNLFKHLNPKGMFVTQATSATFAPQAFWCIHSTIRESLKIFEKQNSNDWQVKPFHTYIPSFGDWGFILASKDLSRQDTPDLKITTKFLTTGMINSLFVFSKDILAKTKAPPVNHLNNQVLVNTYAKSYHNWY